MKFPSCSPLHGMSWLSLAAILLAVGLGSTTVCIDATTEMAGAINPSGNLVWLATVLGMIASVIAVVRFAIDVLVPLFRNKR